MRTLILAMLLAAGACSSGRPPAPHANPATPANPQPSVPGRLDAQPIAQYLGADTATGDRVSELLRVAGIESAAGGSLGYSVWVNEGDRHRARAILLAAAARECLEITVFDDASQTIPGTRPASCGGPPQAVAPIHRGK